ncbi:ATP-dependent helicase [Peptostreptococcaceae bacterium AGR-M142]
MNNLNEKQLQAVNHIDGPCMILAGPGSGKTRVITYRIKNLIDKGINPKHILAISFTKNSAKEMQERTISLVDDASRVSFGTFHSIFFKILRYFKNYDMDKIISESEKFKVIKNILRGLKNINSENEEFIKNLINDISKAKNNLEEEINLNNKEISSDEFIKVKSLYESYKSETKKIDFDDMLVDTYYSLKSNQNILNSVQNKYRYILIDEFQDINKVQFECINLIANKFKNLFVVGDDDQTIYSFRGANPFFLLDFEKNFDNVKKIKLDINYRCNNNIIETSNMLIKNNENRFDKNIKGVNFKNNTFKYINFLNAQSEAKFIGEEILRLNKVGYDFSDICILYRTNMQSRAFVDVFMDLNIPFYLKDAIFSIYDHWISKDILSYLNIINGNTSQFHYKRIINKPFRYISKDNILKASLGDGNFLDELCYKNQLKKGQLRKIQKFEENIDFMRYMDLKDIINHIRYEINYDDYIINYSENRKINAQPMFDILNEFSDSCKKFKNISQLFEHIEAVKRTLEESKFKNNLKSSVILSTIHSCKGLEFENIFISGANEGIIPSNKTKEELVEEERRLFYVAMTRSKSNLYICSYDEKYGKKQEVSRFLKEINFLNKEFKKDDIVMHKLFNKGRIESINNNNIIIDFEDKKRILKLDFCLQNSMIEKLD